MFSLKILYCFTVIKLLFRVVLSGMTALKADFKLAINKN